MAVPPTYAGVYVEELSSGVRLVAAVPTSITAFVGRALRGPTDRYDLPDAVPAVINSFADYERIFGGLWTDSAMSYAVRDFYRNGGAGPVVWGSRTFRGTQWAVFKSNDESLWAQLRLNIGAFLYTLSPQGAFQGNSLSEAYVVKCDRSTTTPTDINDGVVNALIGYAPLEPAEFIILKLRQMAGQLQS